MTQKEEDPSTGVAKMDIDDDEDNKDFLDANQDDDDDDDTSSFDTVASDTDETPVSQLLETANRHKTEGNDHFQAKDYTKAMRCYRRGVNALKKSTHADAQSLVVILYTNLALVAHLQTKYAQSVTFCTQALEINGVHTKALYRRTVALKRLGDYAQALQDLDTLLSIDPAHAQGKKERAAILSLQKKARRDEKGLWQNAFTKSNSSLYSDKEQEEKRKAAAKKRKEKEKQEEEERLKKEWEDDNVSRMARDEAALGYEDWKKERQERLDQEKKERDKKERERKAAERKQRRAAQVDDDDDDDDDELTEQELQAMRGYKKTSDGRTTSYFTRETNVQHDIRPKRLEPTVTPKPIPTPTSAAASVWNQAGTWEEKDTTAWCKDALKERLAAVCKVKELTGDASFATAGGKKRYLFDFHVQLECKVNGKTHKLQLPDICSSTDLECVWSQCGPSSARDAVEQQVRQAVQDWIADFNAQY